MPKITLANFAGGIQASPGFIPNARNTAASDIRNLLVDGNGRLTRRAGSLHKNSSALANALLKVIPCYNAPGGETAAGGTTIRTHLFIQAVGGNADGLLYWDGSAFASVTVNPTPNTASDPVNNFFNRDFDWVIADGRLFLCNGFVTFWVSLTSNPSSTTPQLFWWGMNPNTSSGHTPSAMPTLLDDGADLAIVAGGSLTAGFYGIGFTYYSNPNTTLFGTSKGTGAESRPSSRDADTATVEGIFEVTASMVTASTQTIRISNMDASDDPQITHKRVYVTDVQLTEAAAETADIKLLANGTITDATTTLDITGSAILGAVNDSNDHDNPPTNLERLTFHAGRIWGNRRLSSAVHFSKISSTGTLVVDHMPNANAIVPHQFFVNKSDGDFITGLEPSPSGQRMLIFKENSVTFPSGTGLITGLYQPVTGLTGIDLDISLVNRSAGCIAPKSVATVGGKATLFFGVDKQIWSLAGSRMKPISLAIQPLLDDIPITRLDQPAGVGYRNRYLLAFPSGNNANDLLADYDLNRKYWTIHDLDSDDLAWATGGSDDDILYSILTDTNFVDEYFTGTQDNSVSFTAVWQSNWIQLPSEAIITGIYVYPISSVAVTVRVDTDGTNGAAASYTPAKSNNFRAGVFARGRTFRVRLSGTAVDDIERVEIEYETRS